MTPGRIPTIPSLLLRILITNMYTQISSITGFLRPVYSLVHPIYLF